jgi:putative membrane protein
MRSSSFVTKFSLVCAAVVAVAVGCKTSSSNMNGSSSDNSDGGMMMSADSGMGGMSSDGGMGSMSGSMSGAQSSMNNGMNSAQGSMNSMADAGTSAMNNGMNSGSSSMNSGMNSASSSMNSGATTAADAAKNASGSMGMDNDGGMSGSSSSSGSMSSSSSSGSSGSSGSSASGSSGNLNDGQIAGITAAAHKGEIEAAKLARKQSKNAKVKKFAQMMLKQHTMALKTETNLASKAGITPSDSDQSQQITQANSDLAQKLQGLSGKEFDQAYVQAMVEGHQKVLDTIDNTLIPAAQNDQLKAQLQKERSVVETHLDHAKKLNDSLGGGGTQ